MQLHFAPLQGYTTAAYRNLHHTMWGGIENYYTPFVRIEKGSIRNRDIADIHPHNNSNTPVIPQMLPRDAQELRTISRLFVDNGYTRADINMGCPFPPIALHNRGAGLLQNPQAVKEILQATQEFPQLKYSVKMRLGWQLNNEWEEIIKILNDTPLTHICIHPRIGKQQYKGSVDMEMFTLIYNACKHNIIYNGDITTSKDIEHIHAQYPRLTGIMIGRGLLARPYLTQLTGLEEHSKTEEILIKTQLFHNQLYNTLKENSQGSTQLLMRAKSMWEYFLPHAPHKERKAIIKSTSIEKYEQAVSQMFSTWLKEIASYEL